VATRDGTFQAVTASAAIRAADSPLVGVLRDAGAVFSTRGGHPTAIHYGSAAGELSVCVSAVGLVDRSALGKLELEAPPAQLAHLVARLAGRPLRPGGAVCAGGAWWCAAAPERILVLYDEVVGDRLRARIQAPALHHVAVTIRDRSRELAAIELLGPGVGALLRGLGVYGPSGDPREVPPFTTARVGRVDARWLLESHHRALALVPDEHAGTVWRMIEQAGRPLGISCVGLEAASRYALLERGGQLPAV
jgi:glycine cleavage system aminomethyltransferase T